MFDIINTAKEYLQKHAPVYKTEVVNRFDECEKRFEKRLEKLEHEQKLATQLKWRNFKW